MTNIREDLADLYQIVAKLGLGDHTYTHLSARPKGADYYYIFPLGFRFEEVTPECLLKVSLDGEILEGEECQYNQTGYVIHGSIYKERPDLNSVIHVHTISSIAVSAMKDGLLPISQWALHFYKKVSYHNYNALALDNSEHGNPLVKDMGNNKVIFLRNHGYITCGKTIQEALFFCYHLNLACQAQVAALSCSSELIIPNHETCLKARSDLLDFEENLGQRDWQAWQRFLANNSQP